MKPKPHPAFVRIPHHWIEEGGLRAYRWGKGEGVDGLSALMVFTALLHHLEDHDGSSRRTYDQLSEATGLARATVSRGLSVAAERGLISRPPAGRSSFQITNFDLEKPWAMFPVKAMYTGQTISAFRDFNLRRPAELDILKFFFLCVARRDRATNTANITHEQIHSLSGIAMHNIKRATSGAAALSLIYTEQFARLGGQLGVRHGYRVVGIYPNWHSGTMAREGAEFTKVSGIEASTGTRSFADRLAES